MIYLEGDIQNVFQKPSGTNDQGEQYGGDYAVQMIAYETLRNGEQRMQVVNLRTNRPEVFQSLQGQTVTVPVGQFARGGQIFNYLPSEAEPVPKGGSNHARRAEA